MTTTTRRSHVLAAVAVAALTLLSPAAAGAAVGIAPGHLPYPTGGTTSVGDGINAAHENAQLAEDIPASIKPGWHARPPLCPNATGDTLVSTSTVGKVTVAFDEQGQCSYLSAYASATGQLVWRKKFLTGLGHELVSDGTNVYFSYDSTLAAFNATTGRQLWSRGSGDDHFSVGSGVLVGDEHLYDAATGTYLLYLPVHTTGGTSIVTGGRIYYQTEGAVQAFTTRGAPIWSDLAIGGYKPPSLHRGVLYVDGYHSTSTLALDAATGTLLRTLPASSRPLAFDGDVGIVTDQGWNRPTSFAAVDLRTGATWWTRTIPAVPLAGADVDPGLNGSSPVVENGVVWLYLLTTTGEPAVLTALDETTGATRSRTATPCTVGPGTGSIGIAQHHVFVAGGCGLQTYVAR